MSEKIIRFSALKSVIKDYQACNRCRETMLENLNKVQCNSGMLNEDELKQIIHSADIREKILAVV